MKLDILGVKIDQVNMLQAIELVGSWIKKGGKYYIVTPNIEFIMAAQKDNEFKKILNQADLAIPDSARLRWADFELNQKNFLVKLLAWPLFLLPNLLPKSSLNVVTGTDLMEKLIINCYENGFSVGFLGGSDRVAERLKQKLISKYPKLKITFLSPGGLIDNNGEIKDGLNGSIPATDILFVAFGAVKQEKWIAKNLISQPVKVMMGVGGAFDYLSGSVLRAPKLIRKFGGEWLFRLFVQPWRIKRFFALIRFIFLITIK